MKLCVITTGNPDTDFFESDAGIDVDVSPSGDLLVYRTVTYVQDPLVYVGVTTVRHLQVVYAKGEWRAAKFVE